MTKRMTEEAFDDLVATGRREKLAEEARRARDSEAKLSKLLSQTVGILEDSLEHSGGWKGPFADECREAIAAAEAIRALKG